MVRLTKNSPVWVGSTPTTPAKIVLHQDSFHLPFLPYGIKKATSRNRVTRKVDEPKQKPDLSRTNDHRWYTRILGFMTSMIVAQEKHACLGD
jgi:hypothetical protein